MATTINADTVIGGAIVTGDASGELALQAAGVTKLTVAAAGVTLATPLAVASGGTGGSATPTAGGIVYGTGTVQAVSAAGTSGQLLKSNGASAPTWVTASSGALVFLSSVTASNSATVDLETTFDSTYENYLITITGLTPTVDQVQLCARLKISGAYVTTSTYNSSFMNTGVGTVTFNTAASATQIELSRAGFRTDANQEQGGQVYVQNPAGTTTRCLLRAWLSFDGPNSYPSLLGNGGPQVSTAVTGVRLFMSSGNISVGTFRLYGIANS